jgi:hypothetical protein
MFEYEMLVRLRRCRGSKDALPLLRQDQILDNLQRAMHISSPEALLKPGSSGTAEFNHILAGFIVLRIPSYVDEFAVGQVHLYEVFEEYDPLLRIENLSSNRHARISKKA